MKKFIACMLVLLSLSASGFAGDRGGAFSISPFVGWYNYDETQLLYTYPVYGRGSVMTSPDIGELRRCSTIRPPNSTSLGSWQRM